MAALQFLVLVYHDSAVVMSLKPEIEPNFAETVEQLPRVASDPMPKEVLLVVVAVDESEADQNLASRPMVVAAAVGFR